MMKWLELWQIGTKSVIQVTRTIFLLLMSAVLGFMVVMPQYRLSEYLGSYQFLKFAYDEDQYLRLFFEDYLIPGRVFAHYMLKLVHFMIPTDGFFIGVDWFTAFLSCFCFSLLWLAVTGRVILALFLSFITLFAFELFSTACTVFWDHSIYQWIGGLSGLMRTFPETSFLSVARTPEPQATFILFAIYMVMVVSWFQNPQRQTMGRWLLSVVSAGMLPLGYYFISIPLLVWTLLLAGLSLLYREMRLFKVLLLLLAVYLTGAVGVKFAMQEFDSGHYLIFDSHLPYVTPTVVLGVLLSLLTLRMKPLAADRLTKIFCLSCFLTPTVVLNQQVVTGVLVSIRDWERYFNYHILVIGSLYLAIQTQKQWLQRISKPLPSVLLVGLMFLIFYQGQDRIYHNWLATNLQVLEAEKVIKQIPAAERQVILTDNISMSHALKLRNPDLKSDFILDPKELVTIPVEKIEQGNALNHKNQQFHRPKLYRYLRYQGMTPERLEQVLQQEVAEQRGFHIWFLFTQVDSWYPASDGRKFKTQQILAAIPQVVAEYRAYLQQNQREDLSALYIGKPVSLQIGPQFYWQKRMIQGQTPVYTMCERLPGEDTLQGKQLSGTQLWDQSRSSAQLQADGEFRGDHSRYGYQLVSVPIEVKADRTVKISLQLDRIRGQVDFGVVDQQEHWIAPPVKGRHEITFNNLQQAPIRIIIANNENQVTDSVQFKVHGVEVSEYSLSMGCRQELTQF